jgi:DNA-binding GntR family transcriptional regulator
VMSPVKSEKSAVDALVEAIRSDIMTGALGPGQRIPQDEWAERLQVSRTPVRLALERLESEGFVKLLPRRGAIITELTIPYLEDVLATRLLLEAGLGRAGCRNLSEDDLQALGKIVDEIRDIPLPEGHAQLVDPTHRFHVRLYQAAEAPMMNRFAMQVVEHTHVFLNRFWYANRRIAQVTQAYFAELYQACVDTNLDRVEQLIRDHRVDIAGVILQDRVRIKDLHTLPGILTIPELLRLSAIVDDGHDPVGPSTEASGTSPTASARAQKQTAKRP